MKFVLYFTVLFSEAMNISTRNVMQSLQRGVMNITKLMFIATIKSKNGLKKGVLTSFYICKSTRNIFKVYHYHKKRIQNSPEGHDPRAGWEEVLPYTLLNFSKHHEIKKKLVHGDRPPPKICQVLLLFISVSLVIL